MFDWKKPTVEMLGRWQPWHDGHTALFKKALSKTGQVCIMYRDVGGVDAGIEGQNDNPFYFPGTVPSDFWTRYYHPHENLTIILGTFFRSFFGRHFSWFSTAFFMVFFT